MALDYFAKPIVPERMFELGMGHRFYFGDVLTLTASQNKEFIFTTPALSVAEVHFSPLVTACSGLTYIKLYEGPNHAIPGGSLSAQPGMTGQSSCAGSIFNYNRSNSRPTNCTLSSLSAYASSSGTLIYYEVFGVSGGVGGTQVVAGSEVDDNTWILAPNQWYFVQIGSPFNTLNQVSYGFDWYEKNN